MSLDVDERRVKTDIVLAGVGGQGILTMALLIVSAGQREGLNVRQAEVHGMSQRGGAVEAHVRLSSAALYSDIVPKGRADLIIATEPIEALRHREYLSPSGRIITNTVPFKNIPDYPAPERVVQLLRECGRKVYLLDAAAVGREAGNVRAQNVALVGAAAKFLGLREETLRLSVAATFQAKGQTIADINLRALTLGAARIRELQGEAARCPL